MIELLLVLCMMGFVILAGLLFVVWAVNQHLKARKWQRLAIELAKRQAAAPIHKGSGAWEVTYRSNKNKEITEVIEADSEGAALLILSKRGVSPKGILGSRKI